MMMMMMTVTLRTTVDLHVSEVVRLVGKLGTA